MDKIDLEVIDLPKHNSRITSSEIGKWCIKNKYHYCALYFKGEYKSVAVPCGHLRPSAVEC